MYQVPATMGQAPPVQVQMMPNGQMGMVPQQVQMMPQPQMAPMAMGPAVPATVGNQTGAGQLGMVSGAILETRRPFHMDYGTRKTWSSKDAPHFTMLDGEEKSGCCCRTYGCAPYYHTRAIEYKDSQGNSGFSTKRQWTCRYFMGGVCHKNQYLDVVDGKGSDVGKIEVQNPPCCCAPCKEYTVLNASDSQGNEKFTVRHPKQKCCGKKKSTGCCSCCTCSPQPYSVQFQVHGPRDVPIDKLYATVTRRGVVMPGQFSMPAMDYRTDVTFPECSVNDRMLLLGMTEFIDSNWIRGPLDFVDRAWGDMVEIKKGNSVEPL